MYNKLINFLYVRLHPNEIEEVNNYRQRLSRYDIFVDVSNDLDMSKQSSNLYFDIAASISERRIQLKTIKRAADIADRRASRWARNAAILRIPHDQLYDRTERRAVHDELRDHNLI